jgi:fumarate hydratase subunit beta
MENDIIEIFTPLTDEVIKTLKTGQMVYITGDLYTARDLAHIRLMELLDNGQPMPFDFAGNIVFYAGPSPTPDGMVSGSIGPTTAGRMDIYAPKLIKHGLKAMLGKGLRNESTKQAIKDHGGIYFAGTGGIAALMSKCVKNIELIAFDDLGTEAIRKLKVEKMPAVVAIDCEGNDIYERS